MAQAIAAKAGNYICLCLGARGEFFCIECEQYFCQTCRISHRKANVSKSHKLVEAIKTESKDCEMCLTKYAGQHFCLDCSQYFCSNCKMIHLRANVSKNHVFTDSSDIEKTETSNYGSQLVQTEKKKTNVEQNKKDSIEKDDMMTAKKIRQKCHDSVLRDITDREIGYLKAIEGNFPIKMTIDQVNCEIILEGIQDEVMNAKQEVFDALRKFAHYRFCKERALIVKEQVQWYLKDTNNIGHPILIEYPDYLNMDLEMAYVGESGLSEVEFKDDQGEEYVIVLKDMKEYLKKDKTNYVDVLRRQKVHQGDGDNYEPPPEWDKQGSDNVKLVTLPNTSLEYKSVEQMFMTSVFNGRPEWVIKFNKRTFRVTKIERVQNLSLYHMYAAKKALMDKQNPPGTNNEKELWHSPPNEAIFSINVYGFNRSYCQDKSKDAYWGEGIYFSADASYSARRWLSKPSASGEYHMFMCKVLTGVSCPGQRGMRFLPVRKDGTMLNYDSATDANYNPTVEYVIFHDEQAYPQYCIRFKY
ncbi:protein mono-ADP-ribosyltransferase PARP14-like [Mytilus edulis]|uniref:protein mono-ADP-ribosyltransferase PARP14-like n=1 Tax=Mytilus edulis TaxID=6550 RepID=UPI0039EE08ED